MRRQRQAGRRNGACGRGETIALPAVQLGPNEAYAWDIDPATLDIPRGAFGRTHLRVQAEVLGGSTCARATTEDPTTKVLHTIEVIDRETGRATLFLASPEVAGDGSVSTMHAGVHRHGGRPRARSRIVASEPSPERPGRKPRAYRHRAAADTPRRARFSLR